MPATGSAPAAIEANRSSALGVEERVAAGDGVHRVAAEDALDGRLELLSRQRAGDRRHRADRVGHVARRELRAQAAVDAVAQLVVQLGAVGEHDEQHELARTPLVVLEVDDEAVRDLRQLLDDAVELTRAETDAAAVERGVRAAR